MRTVIGSLFILAMTISGCVATKAGVGMPPDDGMIHHPNALPAPDSLRYTPPKPRIVTFDNGLRVYLLEDHELPLVSARMVISAGTIYDAADKLGVSALTGTILRTGGTQNIGGDELDAKLEFMAASIEVRSSSDASTVSMSALSKDTEEVLRLYADVIRRPSFDQNKVDLATDRMHVDIRVSLDSPGNLARVMFRQLVYGKESAYSRRVSHEHVDAIDRKDIVDFHRRLYSPNHAILGITGDFESEEMLLSLHNLFDGWTKSDTPLPEIATDSAPPPGVYYVERKINQAIIRMGHEGLPRHSPDSYAVEVMNRIYGQGTFTSRLGVEIRSNRGLAYSVFGAVFNSPDPKTGMALALASTRANAAGETISVMLSITQGMSTSPFTAKEIADAKSALINSFIFKFSSRSAIVQRQVQLAFEGYPADYLETYLERIRTVTSDDVARVAKKYLRLDDLRILVVGDRSQLDQPLETFGTVTELEIPSSE